MNPLTRVRPWLLRSLAAGVMAGACLVPSLNALYAQEAAVTPVVAVDRAPVLSFAPIVKRVAPSVVTVLSTRTAHARINQLPPGARLPPGMDEQLRRFFDSEGQGQGLGQGQGGLQDPTLIPDQEEKALGSGVIVSADGYILTNNHVIENADQIKVSFAKGREVYPAKLVGADASSDLAVLKIDAGKSLPMIAFGDSGKAEVGDVVLAIGNPFGVGQSVTMGIISARGRDMHMAEYEDFIQTDASINPGNSGGALVDTAGRLIGINTAILSPSGGNLGIGFAVPVNQARLVLESIIEKHHVVRSHLGIIIQDLTPEFAKSFHVPSSTNGVLVGGVIDDGPAAKAGVKKGDVVTAFNGTAIEDMRELRMMASQTPPGTKAVLQILRNGKPETLHVTMEEMDPDNATASVHTTVNQPTHANRAKLGVQLSDLDEQTRAQLKVPADIQGAVVTEVVRGSLADRLQIKRGDIITEVDHKAITSTAEAAEQIGEAQGSILLSVWNHKGSHYVIGDLLEKPAAQPPVQDQDKDTDK